MKRTFRLIALLLAAVLLLSCAAYAADEKPVYQMTDEELIAKFNIPDNWARKALIFATRYGLLAGKGGDNLAPTDNTTRAEMATILCRILRTTTKADLSQFTDVKPSNWFYDAMAKVQAMGILANNGETTMRPRDNITREEVFVSLARAFGVTGTSRQALYDFTDWQDVSEWAAVELSAMISMGYVNGSGDKLNPKGLITRQELAQVLNNLLNHVGTKVGANYTGKCALSTDSIPAGTNIKGNLLLTNEVAAMTLENVTVSGRLIIQGNGRIALTLKNCKIGELVLCRKADLNCDGGVTTMTILANTKLSGTANKINLYADLIVLADTSVGTVYSYKDGAKCTINGTVTSFWINGENQYINGSGTIEKLAVCREGSKVLCNVGKRTDAIARDMGHISAVQKDSGWADSGNPQLTLAVQLMKLPTGKNDSVVTWTVDGTQVQSGRMLLEDGCTVTCPMNFSSAIQSGKYRSSVTVKVVSGKYTFSFSYFVQFEDPAKVEALTIRSQNIQGTITKTTAFYSNFNVWTKEFSGQIGTVPEFTQVTILKISHGLGVHMRLPDGREGWSSFADVHVIPGKYYTEQDYSKAAKEYYVNKLHSFSSSTGYFIWISLYTQRVNIFQGSKGNWTLIKSGPCSTGTNSNPTPVEEAIVNAKTAKWVYEAYYCHHVTLFDESRAFHSRPTKYEGGVYNPAIGYPASGGCVRLLDDLCIWIYDNIPMYTPVHCY